MKMTFVKGCLFALTAGLFSANAAIAQDKAGSLEELLNMVQEARVSESQEARQREAEFRQQKNQQQQLLEQARQTRNAEEQRSERLEATYEEQEIEVAAKIAQRNERLGSLRELFGHLTSTAGDLRATIDTSIVSAQYPDRGEFLNDLIDKMNSNTRLPSIEEIEQLWFELQREMIASGQVVEFPGVVIKPNGEKNDQQVVRIGTYNLVSNGKYLQFMPADNQMMELPRQPSSEIQSSAANLQAAESGLVRTGIDPTGPTGGSLLAALIESPTWEERWHQGGGVGYVITAVGIFGFILGIWRIIYLTGVSAKVSSQLKSSTPNNNNPLGRVLQVAEDNKNVDPETLELKLEEAVLKERPKIESGLALLKIIAAVAPLMGLLGTVVGMILTFQAITIFGAGDPKNMAGGISSALITTVLGLVVAIPTVLLHTLVNGRAKRVIHVLDEQTAGIIAENSERK